MVKTCFCDQREISINFLKNIKSSNGDLDIATNDVATRIRIAATDACKQVTSGTQFVYNHCPITNVLDLFL